MSSTETPVQSSTAAFNLKDAFTRGIQALLQTWPALRLALDNDDDSSTVPQQKLGNLLEEVVDYFEKYGTNIEVEDMVFFYKTFFHDVFALEVDDGSVELTAQRTCALFHTLIKRDTRLLDELIQASVQCAGSQIKSQVVVENCDVEVASDFEEDEEQEVSVPVVTNNSTPSSSQQRSVLPKVEVEIDENGLEWTPVVGRNRRRQQQQAAAPAQPPENPENNDMHQ